MKNLILILFPFFFLACQQQENETTGLSVIDVEKSAGTMTLNFSELINDICAVTLESSENSLIGQYPRFYIGDDYIVSLDNDRILLFDSQGNYQRQLSQKGKGPMEFTGITDYLVIPEEDMLLVSNYNTESLLKLNISKKGFGAIETPGRVMLMERIGDEILCIGGYPEYSSFILDLEGNVINTAPKKDEQRYGVGRLGWLEGGYYIPATSDTLFSLKDRELKPLAAFVIPDKVNQGQSSRGNMLFAGERLQHLITFTVQETTIEVSEDYSSISIQNGIDYIWDSASGKLLNLQEKMGYWDHEEGEIARYDVMGDRIIFIIQADRWLEITETFEDPPTAIQQQLLDQVGEVGLEDNPVLLIGTLNQNYNM